MSCSQDLQRLSAYVDGELPPDEVLELTEHLTSCSACAQEYESMLRTVGALRAHLVRHRAPDTLRARVRAAIREDRPVRSVPAGTRRRLPWRPLAAAVVIAVASSAATLLATTRRATEHDIADEVLTSHIRSLMPDHLTDVRSNDQHNVKPWFNGRLDYSPAVPRLDDEGFPLLGGRLDYVHKRPVAVVVYGRRQHLINVYSWPTDAGELASTLVSRQGYQVLHWRHAGVEYWVVSDVNASDLQHFAALVRASGAASAAPAPADKE